MELTDIRHYQNTRWLLVSVLIIVVDQITKHAALDYLTLTHSVKITSFFNFTLLFNRGAAFSFLSQAGGWQHWLLASVSIIVSIVILHLLLKLKPIAYMYLLSLAMILGGALGNLWDRVSYGYVIDFLHFHFHTWHFAIFNIADSAITIGTMLLIGMQLIDFKNQ